MISHEVEKSGCEPELGCESMHDSQGARLTDCADNGNEYKSEWAFFSISPGWQLLIVILGETVGKPILAIV